MGELRECPEGEPLTLGRTGMTLGRFQYAATVVRMYDLDGRLLASYTGSFGAMTTETNLVLIRRSQVVPFGMDLIDSRDGFALAWARLHAAYLVAGRVNEAYPDACVAPDREVLMMELASHLVDSDDADDEDALSGGFMVPRRERLEFVEVLSELVGWVGRRVSVSVGPLGVSGAASFTGTLIGVDPEAEALGDRFVLVRFDDGASFVDLDPETMPGFRVRLEPAGLLWLEFEKEGCRALSIRPIDEIGGAP